MRPPISNNLGKQLHDRATRGEILSAEEQTQLEQWYVLQDRMESDILSQTMTTDPISTLQAQIDATLAQLLAVTKRIQELAAENETLRRDIATLHRQLAHLSTSQSA